jgi:hypothetical protein
MIPWSAFCVALSRCRLALTSVLGQVRTWTSEELAVALAEPKIARKVHRHREPIDDVNS